MAMSRLRGSVWALVAGLGAAILPGVASAQSVAAQQPAAQRSAVVLPFEGEATEDLLGSAEATLRGALLARGITTPDRAAVNIGMGLTPPTDPLGIGRAAHIMGATYALRGQVRPLTGQYNLSLTLVDAATGRSATREENVPDEGAGEVYGRMLDALLDPSTWGPPPVDPAVEREAAARRQAEADAARQRDADAAAATQRAADEAARRSAADAAAHPVRRFDAGGPFSLAGGLMAGGRLSGVHQPTGPVRNGTAPAEATAAAVALRVDGSYGIAALNGLELAASVMLLTVPTSALGLGVGAQYTFPTSGRLPLRGTAGVLVGLWQGLSGARATTAWINPFVRAEWGFTPAVAAYLGLSLDIAPADNGGVTSLGVMAGVRVRFGS